MSNFKLRGDKPLIKQLNKNLILLLLGILVIVILLMVSFALTSTEKSESNTADISSGYAAADTARVAALPAGYQDADKIHSILARGQPQGDGTSPQMQSEIAALRQQQAALLAQLNSLKQNNMNQPEPVSPLQQEALTSSIFFAGGAPQQTPANAAQQAEQAAAKKAGDATQQNTPPDPYSQQNMQTQKVDFLNSKPSKDIYNANGVQYPISKYELQASTVIPAILQTELDSDLPGVITAVVSQNVYDSISGQYLLIPKGSKIMGEYLSNVSYGQSQLQAKFTRIIRPDGTSIVLPSPSPGVDQMGISGFSDEVNNHWGSVIGAGVLMAVFNLPSIIATNQQSNSSSSTPTCTSVPNGDGTYSNVCTGGQSVGSQAGVAALQSVGQAASQVGSAVAQKSLNIQPTITIHAGYQFGIIVTKDIVLPPYQTPMQTIPNLSNQ